jgi:metal-responsive CopG/Arc/MetJ family transcriptional regulator
VVEDALHHYRTATAAGGFDELSHDQRVERTVVSGHRGDVSEVVDLLGNTDGRVGQNRWIAELLRDIA